jgi:hypothetical protein
MPDDERVRSASAIEAIAMFNSEGEPDIVLSLNIPLSAILFNLFSIRPVWLPCEAKSSQFDQSCNSLADFC